jgi:small subunit ribosomal protein S20
MRTQIKKVRALSEAGEKAEAQEALANAIVKIDKACTKGIIHSNQASRRVSRLTLLVNGL